MRCFDKQLSPTAAISDASMGALVATAGVLQTPRKSQISNRQISLALFLLASQAVAQVLGPGPGRQANLEAVQRWSAKQRQTARETRLVWNGVVADTTARTVTVVAEAVGLTSNGTVEFILVNSVSDKDYEALAVALAQPADVAQALEAIGLPRGLPAQPQAFRFWPRGEHVKLSLRPLAGGTERALGDCVFDQATQGAMSNIFTYVGSQWHADGSCAAGAVTPGALVAAYNEPTTLLDLPFAITQNAAYGRFVAKGLLLPRESLWEFVFQPVLPPEAPPRVVLLNLAAQPAAATTRDLGDIAWICRGDAQIQTNTFAAFAQMCRDLVERGREPFVSLRFDDQLTVQAAAEAAAAVLAIEGGNGIRLDGPPAGQLFAQAFLPQPQWRVREKRLMQPYELRLERNADGTWQRTLVHIHEDWSDESSLDPKLSAQTIVLGEWSDLKTAVEKLGKGIGTLLVFAPGDAPLATFMEGVRLVQEILPTVYVMAE